MSIAALIYVFAATAFGLLISAFVSTQVAAIFGTAILTAMTAAHYSGFLFPASTLEGPGRVMGLSFSCTLVPDRKPRRLCQRARGKRVYPRDRGIAWFWHRVSPAGPPVGPQAKHLAMRRWIENVFHLGLKELASLSRDVVMVVLIIYVFTVAVYSEATGHENGREQCRRGRRRCRPVDVVIPDQGCPAAALIFSTPREIDRSEVDQLLDKGQYTFILEIPPRLEADLLGEPRPVNSNQCRCDGGDPSRRWNGLYPGNH